MKRLPVPILLTHILLIILISGCASAQTPAPSPTISPTLAPSPIPPSATPSPIPPTITPSPIPPTLTPEPTCTQETIDSSIPIGVSPFYNSEGVQINVGNYSEQLRTSDPQELTSLAQEMASQKETLTPEQMFVLSIRLYDLGCKDSSVYWWYEARFRAILFKNSLDPAHVGGLGQPAFELRAAYGAFSQLAGNYLNGYAGCDIDKWINIVKMVRDDNPTPPELDKIFLDVVFVERGQWQQINDGIAAQFDGLVNDISTNKDTIKQQRAANNLDAQFCH